MSGVEVALLAELSPGQIYDLYILVRFADHYPKHSLDPAHVTLLEGSRVLQLAY